MTKRLVDLDDDLLEEARAVLGDVTMKATVDAALRDFVAAARRADHLRRLATATGTDLVAPLNAFYVADKSALARFRHPDVSERWGSQLVDGLIATCAIVDLELLYSALSPSDYEALRVQRAALPSVEINSTVTEYALDIQRQLAQRSQHRVPVPDLLIAAAAQISSLTVLHYDSDFDLIASVTGQPIQWIAPRGTIS